jgi:hypothetical protein
LRICILNQLENKVKREGKGTGTGRENI